MRLENTLQSLNNKRVFLENTLQSQEIINETNVLYQSIKDNISKLNKEVEVKNADLEDYNIIEKNYNKILQSNKNPE